MADPGRRTPISRQLDLQDPRVSVSSVATTPLQLRLFHAPELLRPNLRPDGTIEFVLRGSSGERVALDTSTDLNVWVPARTIPLYSPEYRFREAPTPLVGQRFYRVTLLP